MLKLAAADWAAQGWDQHIISTGQQLGPFARELASAGFKITHCPESKSLGWIDSYRKALRRIAPDVVHEHAEGLSLIKSSVPALMGMQVFRTVHNVFEFKGYLRLTRLIERRLVRLLGVRTITISQSVRSNESTRFSNRSILCWNWFDDSYFRPPSDAERAQARLELKLEPQEVVLVTVGNGNDTKNYSALIWALPKLTAATNQIKYLMVGHEHSEQKERQAVSQAGVAEHVVFAGPQKNVRRYLWAADIFVIPSLREGFSIAALEGLGTGITCVYAASPGLLDLKAFPLAISWTSPDPNSLANTLTQVILDPTFRDRNKLNSDFVRDYFGVKRRATVYTDLWSQSLSAGIQ
jgi:glycosyltransferase involved in cell wall biosynthesis